MQEQDVCVGYVSDDIASQWDIIEQSGKPIFKSKKWENGHGLEHKHQFKSAYSFKQTIENIPKIIENPDYVYYNQNEKGLEYYKKVIENVTLVVRVTGKRALYIATIYPSSTTKLANRKIKEIEKQIELMEKYTYKG